MNKLNVMTRLLGACVFSLAISACGDDEPGGGSDVDAGNLDIDASNLDIDASTGTDCSICAPEATCDDSGADAVCSCPDGFMGDGIAMCMDIDECADMVDGCVAPADGGSCTNETGTFTCSCQEFFAGDGTTAGTGCVEDKCASGNNNCAVEATCTATADMFTCECPTGLAGDGTVCADVDECALGTDTCALADCVNTVGAFVCQNIIVGTPYVGVISLLNSTPFLAGNMDDLATPAECDGGGVLAQLDLSELGAPGVTITGSNGIAREPLTGTLYIIYKVADQVGRSLGTLNPASGAIARIGNTGENVSSIAFDGTGNLFGSTGDGGTLSEVFVAIDKSTAAITMLTTITDGSDGTIVGFNEVDGFFYHFGGRDTNPGADLIDVSVGLTDPLNPVFSATTTTVTRGGFNYDEPFGMIFGWPTPDAFGVGNLDRELISVATNSTDPLAPSLEATLVIGTGQAVTSFSPCNPGPSTTINDSYPRGLAWGDITPQLLGGECTSALECSGNVCNTLGSNQCEPADICGNGTLEGAEACDDGNTLDGDGCQMDCTILLLADGSTCTSNNNQCINVCDTLDSNMCEPADTCGNGVVEGAEACDDGNLTDADGCEMDCTVTLLADGMACTDSAQCVNVCDTQDSNMCEPVDTCGNGVVEGMEACDDGNLIDDDGCQMDCSIPL